MTAKHELKKGNTIGMLNSTGKAVHKELQATEGSLDSVGKSNSHGQTHQLVIQYQTVLKTYIQVIYRMNRLHLCQ